MNGSLKTGLSKRGKSFFSNLLVVIVDRSVLCRVFIICESKKDEIHQEARTSSITGKGSLCRLGGWRGSGRDRLGGDPAPF